MKSVNALNSEDIKNIPTAMEPAIAKVLRAIDSDWLIFPCTY